MYNKSGGRNKQNKAIEKTTTEKKETKREREEAAKGTCNILAMRFISFFGCNCLQSTEGFSRTHTPSYAHTHTLTSLDSHTHTHTRPQRANALYITAKRAINSKNGGNNVRCAAHNLQHAAHALCVASTAAIP